MLLKVSNLSKRSGQNWIFRSVSLEVGGGEILGVFGDSPIVKTKLLSVIGGVEKANGGSIFADSADLTTASRQTRNFHFPTDANGSILQRLFTAGKPGDPASAESLLDAANNGKKIFLLDDTFASMTGIEKQRHFTELRTLAKSMDLTVIFATNNYEDVLLLCDTVAVMAGGEIVQIGTPRDVYLEPQSHAVAGLTGRNNLFAARRLTSSKAAITEFQTIEGEHRLMVQKSGTKTLGALNQNVTLGIRPEHVTLAFGASFPEDNIIRATITGVNFLGATTLVELDSGGLKLNSLVLRLVGLNIGDECMLGLPPDRIAIFTM